MESTGGFLQPEEVIKQLNIKKDMIVTDFGCGSGYFSIPLAKIVDEGKVYSLDILSEALESVQSRARFEGIFNIETRRCDLEVLNNSKLEDNSMDFVFLANILFQSNAKSDIIKEAKRVLKMNGKLVVIDWKEDKYMGPPNFLAVSLESIKELIKEQNLKFEKEIPVDKYHWGALFTKS
ncbi:class I SAM-dependent methyltransferase [Patescibacteria group bacterium]|nr:class I SAM-dependent methyltransferase [Patescibacteria group bacterium]